MQSIINEVGSVPMPGYQGDQLYMHPLDVADPRMPAEFARWQSFVESLLPFVPLTEGEIYVTIDEKQLRAGQTHRRPRAHIDGIWQPAKSAHGTPGHGMPNDGGGSHRTHFMPANSGGGLILVSSFEGCRGYRGEYHGEFGQGGDLEHLRDQLDAMESFIMKPDHVYQCNVFAAHESIPVAHDVHRSLVRLSLPEQVIIH